MADALFGGSFDPIHIGHLFIAEHVRTALGFNRVVFVPARRNPLKAHPPVASDEDRLEMVRRATAGNAAFVVEPWETQRDRPSYTVDTVRGLTDAGRLSTQPGLIIGDELVDQLARWHAIDELLDLVRLVVVTRMRPREVAETLPAGARIVSNLVVPVSSSDIRDRLRSGATVRYLVPDVVYDYIEARRLYRPTPA